MANPVRGAAAVALARSAAELPAAAALRGGTLYEPKWDGFRAILVVAADVRSLPLERRRQLLDELGAEWRPTLHLSMVTDQLQQAREWFDELAAAGVEGVVAKAAAGPYVCGALDWIKVKRRETLDVVLGAVIGPITRPEAVVVGRYDENGRLRIAGRSAPLQPHVCRQLGAQLRAADPGHPWPAVLAPAALGGRFTGARDPIELTLV
ncbi:ATP-dependent DNA ligase [Agromyces larvae]|uniref:ATP-dependent DNA ligase family profile domain-containing protein n=1 Tax=Agromyces larvae TaxID=2929802 RepID=A0ABY4BVC7_9MICO|nr:hypothetical protein [Agromyces larvae]UOE43161.1 hypothetical protein MTO99_13315 [Agromyces larvae]